MSRLHTLKSVRPGRETWFESLRSSQFQTRAFKNVGSYKVNANFIGIQVDLDVMNDLLALHIDFVRAAIGAITTGGTRQLVSRRLRRIRPLGALGVHARGAHQSATFVNQQASPVEL
jgi:hypothetical protein